MRVSCYSCRLVVPRLGALAVLIGLTGLGGVQPRVKADPSPEGPTNLEASAEREERLLQQLCRYLKLTRTQVLHLAPFARQASRGRDLLERECEERRRVFDPLADTQPDAAERLRLAMEQRREQVLGELTALGTRALIRNLTREQIALAWRLGQGKPPKYAQADPALLDPAAGFVTIPTLNFGSLEVSFSDPGTPRLAPLSSRSGTDRFQAESLSLNRRLILRNEVGYEVEIPAETGRRTASDSRPFPQLVAETNDPNDLMPALQPLAGRLFFSDHWLPVLEGILRSGESPGGSRLKAPGPLRMVRDFRMERSFRDLTGRGPDLEPLGGVVEHGLYLFNPGQGLRVPDTGVTDHYALQLNLLYHGGNSYQKILDFKNGASDGGLYFYQGHLTFYTLANGGEPKPEAEHRLRLERDRTTRIVRGYLDLRPIFAFIDLDDDAVFEKGSSALFVDDTATKNEQGAGAFRSLTVWGPAPPK